MVFCILILIQLWISPLLYTNEILSVKKKKRQKSQKYITSKENFSNFVFYYSDTEAHLYLNDFCQLSSTLQVQKKKYEIWNWVHHIFSTHFQYYWYMYEEKYEFQLYLYAKKGKKVPLHPLCNQIISNFSPFFFSVFWEMKSRVVLRWVVIKKTPIKMERMLN